jgi:hypothetical protein
MGRRIVGIIILVLIVIGAWYIYQHNLREKQELGGEVHWVEGQPTPEQKAAFAKENSGDTADGQSEHKIRTARAEDAAGNPEGQAAAGQTVTGPAAATTATKPAAAAPTTAPAAAQPAATTFFSTGSATPASLPVSDSQSPNAPNGMRFAGSGTYQWYRQGNITWRIDTVSGHSCIIYATMEEWRKQIVYSHGCGRDS